MLIISKNIPEKPKPPLSTIIREGTVGTCPKCHSTEVRKRILGLRIGKKIGCLQSECENFYLHSRG